MQSPFFRAYQARHCIPHRKYERGATLVEAALTFLIIWLSIIGVMEFGRAVWVYNWVSHVARDATRYASVHGYYSTAPATADSITSLVQGEAVGIDTSSVTVTTNWIPDNKPGSAVQVIVSCSILPAVNLILPSQLNVGATSQMTILP